MPGQTLGRYVLLGELGSGGMGTVLKAYDESLDRAIAIKLLHPEAAKRHAERLNREAKALAKLSHPNVVHVYEVGRADDQWFIAMELVRGQTLRQWQDEQHEWRECVKVYLQAGAGLAAAHEVGLVHRDFKPDNCIVDERGRPRVLDFGLVRETDVPSDDEPSLRDELAGLDARPVSLTRTGAILGTAAYMPLEQFNGKPADARSDQFSFCVSLYEALYGERPFDELGVGRLIAALTKGDIRRPPKGSRVPTKLRRVLIRGLASDPDARWPSMHELLERLRGIVAPRTRVGLPLVVGGGLAALGLGLWGPQRTEVVPPLQPCQGAAYRLEGVWDGPRREAVSSAFRATKLVYADDTYDKVEGTLTAYTDRWIQLRTEICEATRVRSEQSEALMDLRIGCLDDRLRDLGALTTVLAHADAEVVKNAALGVQQLPSPADCAALDRDDSSLFRPQDPELTSQVQRVREGIAEARARSLAGKYAEGMERAKSALELAQTIDYSPALAEAALIVAQIHERLMVSEPAREAYWEALYAAAASGHDRIEVEALIGLLSVVGTYSNDPETALRHGMHAAAVAQRLGNPPRLLAGIALYRGNVHMGNNELELALQHYRRSVDLSEGVGDAERIHLAAINNLAAVQGQQGHYRDAVESFESAIEMVEDKLGPWHPIVGNHYNNLGVTYSLLEEPQLAVRSIRRALEIYDKTLRPDHPEIGRAHHNMGVVQVGLNDLEASHASYLKALELKTRGMGPQSPSVALTSNNVADSLIRLGRPREAIPYIEDAIRIWTKAGGEDSSNNIYGLMSLSEAYLALEQPERAMAPIHRALGLAMASEFDPIEVAKLEFVAARVIWRAEGKHDEAMELARSSRERYEDSDRPSTKEIADIDAWLASPE